MTVSLDHWTRTLKFDVKLAPLTMEDREVTANFYSPQIDNNSTFYTDSNGLKMQKRVFKGGAKSFYPVTSAIAIRDTHKKFQMTVMNSHTQAGSATKKGRIELLQQRVSKTDDHKGLGEALYDVDFQGIEIPINASYQV